MRATQIEAKREKIEQLFCLGKFNPSPTATMHGVIMSVVATCVVAMLLQGAASAPVSESLSSTGS